MTIAYEIKGEKKESLKEIFPFQPKYAAAYLVTPQGKRYFVYDGQRLPFKHTFFALCMIEDFQKHGIPIEKIEAYDEEKHYEESKKFLLRNLVKDMQLSHEDKTRPLEGGLAITPESFVIRKGEQSYFVYQYVDAEISTNTLNIKDDLPSEKIDPIFFYFSKKEFLEEALKQNKKEIIEKFLERVDKTIERNMSFHRTFFSQRNFDISKGARVAVDDSKSRTRL